MKPKSVNVADIADEITPRGDDSRVKDVVERDLSDIEILPEYVTILSAFDEGRKAIFVTGRAGTGKSTLIRYLAAVVNNVAVTAPTGIAAINVGGETLHSFFRLPPRVFDPKELKAPGGEHADVLEAVKLLIVDEVSMVTPNMVDAIDVILRTVRDPWQPFGGVPVVFVGDLLQLPPVVSSTAESSFFADRYGSAYFFGADVFRYTPVVPIVLSEVRRQRDARFVDALSRIRLNKDHRDDDGLINRSCYRDKVSAPNTAVVLVPTNAAANRVNGGRLAGLASESSVFEATTQGTLPANKWKAPAPYRLELKPGARVLFVSNNRPHWVNGDLGEVVSIWPNEVGVRMDSTGVIELVTRATWQRFRYQYHAAEKRLEREAPGGFRQLARNRSNEDVIPVRWSAG